MEQGLTKDEVIWAEDLSKRPGSDGVHCARFQIHQNCSRHILATYIHQMAVWLSW